MTHLLTSTGASSFLGITTAQLGRLVREQALPTVELPGGVIRFDQDELVRFVEASKRPATALATRSAR
jgi:predicted site-specific integrase-resolvase